MQLGPSDSIFYGDGRKSLAPVNAPEGTQPVRVRRGIARLLADAFEFAGESHHSAAGNTVWVVVTYCIERKIPYQMHRQGNG